MTLSPAHAARVAESDRLNRYRIQWREDYHGTVTVLTTHRTSLREALHFAREHSPASIFDRTTRRDVPFGQNSA